MQYHSHTLKQYRRFLSIFHIKLPVTIHKTLDSYLESKNIINIKIELPISNNLDEINEINAKNKKTLKKIKDYYIQRPSLKLLYYSCKT